MKIDGITFENVTHSLGGSPVLLDISLDVNFGEFLAIIGPSGSGKTTLLNLLVGALAPDIGRIYFGGEDARKFIQLHPGRVAFVPQMPNLISGSVIENIALGVKQENVNLSRVSNLIQLVKLESWAESLECGLETILDKGSMSGGQVQRLAIARALYSSPSILIMDEPTSALDAETEHFITEQIKSLKGETTLIVVAHRLSTIEDADRVIYVEKGRIQGQGKFDALRKSIPELERAAQLFTLRSTT